MNLLGSLLKWAVYVHVRRYLKRNIIDQDRVNNFLTSFYKPSSKYCGGVCKNKVNSLMKSFKVKFWNILKYFRMLYIHFGVDDHSFCSIIETKTLKPKPSLLCSFVVNGINENSHIGLYMYIFKSLFSCSYHSLPLIHSL